jgi:hypothetical protein
MLLLLVHALCLITGHQTGVRTATVPTTTTASTTGAAAPAAVKPHRLQRLSLSALYGATVYRSSQVSTLLHCLQCTRS